MEKSRDQLIKDYERIKNKWDDDKELISMLPEVYENICYKLDALKAGAEYKVTDKTNDLKTMIAYVGGCIPSINYTGKDNKLININDKITYNQAEAVAKEF
jgi:hypothetical protein